MESATPKIAVKENELLFTIRNSVTGYMTNNNVQVNNA